MKPFNIVLVEPEIPQNTGNIARTCAATGAVLHLVKPIGFEIDDRKLKRAGLDYWHLLDIRCHGGLGEFFACCEPDAHIVKFSTKARECYTGILYPEGTYLMFGKETAGLPERLLSEGPGVCARIPMLGGARSLNLSNSVAVALYEALRQNVFTGLEAAGKGGF